MKYVPIYNIASNCWMLGKVVNHQAGPLTKDELEKFIADYTKFESAALKSAQGQSDLNYEVSILREHAYRQAKESEKLRPLVEKHKLGQIGDSLLQLGIDFCLKHIAELEAKLAECPPSPTPSSPSTAPAQSAADPATQPPAAPPVELGQLSAEQLRLLDKYLLDPMYKSHMTAQVALGLMSLLWKIVRPAAMKAAGTSSSEPTPKHGSWGSNA